MAHTLEQVIQPHLSPTVKRENWDGFGYDYMGTDYYGKMKGMKHLHRLIQNDCDGCTCVHMYRIHLYKVWYTMCAYVHYVLVITWPGGR